jgi:hypothetical protein
MLILKKQKSIKAIINLKKNKVPLRKISEVIKNKYARKLHYSYISKLINRPQLNNLVAIVSTSNAYETKSTNELRIFLLICFDCNIPLSNWDKFLK